MSNSPLVSYTKISPNRTSPRNHAIDTITIHCVVGQCSVETLGNVFAPKERQASSNYGVGVDGRIGMYCEEKDRSWCSSSGTNDHRAITIEVASDTTEPYAVNAKAYAALLDLVTDICKRNGIKKLLWKADKSLIGQVDKQNMTVHRWFANKSCPGTYLYNKHSEIAAEVNKRLGISESPSATTPKPIKADPKTIWNFFKGKGLNDFAVAGIMGNLYAESRLLPNNLQNTYSKKLGMSDEEYTKAVDNGSYTNFVRDSAGYGHAQWTYWSRKQALLNHAKAAKKSIADLKMQLDFMWKELQGYSSVMKTLKSAKSILEASNAVLIGYERPANQSEAVQKQRAKNGQTYYDNYAKEDSAPSGAFEPYRVRVAISDLNIRKGPGTNYIRTGRFTGKGIFTIVAESSGTGSKKGWGKLKSGAGWISLDYANRLS